MNLVLSLRSEIIFEDVVDWENNSCRNFLFKVEVLPVPKMSFNSRTGTIELGFCINYFS